MVVRVIVRREESCSSYSRRKSLRKPAIRAIFVDFGNVCATYDFSRFFEKFSAVTKVPIARVKATLFLRPEAEPRKRGYSSIFEALECGEITSVGFFRVLTNALNCRESIDHDTFVHLWSDIFLKENNGLEQLLLKLPQQKYLLSNTNQIVYERYITECDIVAKHFPLHDQHVLSYEVGAIKPDPLIYKIALARARVRPEETLFLDDMPENIEAWRALGGHGIVYHAGKNSLRELRRELRTLGVLD